MTALLLLFPFESNPTRSFLRKAAVVPMIVADGLVKRFATKGRWIEAVRDVSFQVREGEVYGLLGPNGAGKTTTLRMVMGLLEPDQGSVSIDGKSSQENSVELRRQIGMISTNDGVYPWLTAKEMLLYFGDLYGIDPPLAHSRLFELSAMLGITRLLDQRCNTLSTGQRQRVILARGLMHDPPVILLDEPTRGLDIVGSRTIFDFIGHLKQLGKSVLLSTHRLDEAERFCDRFGLLHEGQMQMEGTLTELKERSGRSNLTDIFLDLLSRPANFMQAEHQ
ncbi:MAG: ABC transporter ATP-binding protein [Pirellulaceae bacterium]